MDNSVGQTRRFVNTLFVVRSGVLSGLLRRFAPRNDGQNKQSSIVNKKIVNKNSVIASKAKQSGKRIYSLLDCSA
jgi:hypothetical protein